MQLLFFGETTREADGSSKWASVSKMSNFVAMPQDLLVVVQQHARSLQSAWPIRRMGHRHRSSESWNSYTTRTKHTTQTRFICPHRKKRPGAEGGVGLSNPWSRPHVRTSYHGGMQKRINYCLEFISGTRKVALKQRCCLDFVVNNPFFWPWPVILSATSGAFSNSWHGFILHN